MRPSDLWEFGDRSPCVNAESGDQRGVRSCLALTDHRARERARRGQRMLAPGTRRWMRSCTVTTLRVGRSISGTAQCGKSVTSAMSPLDVSAIHPARAIGE